MKLLEIALSSVVIVAIIEMTIIQKITAQETI